MEILVENAGDRRHIFLPIDATVEWLRNAVGSEWGLRDDTFAFRSASGCDYTDPTDTLASCAASSDDVLFIEGAGRAAVFHELSLRGITGDYVQVLLDTLHSACSRPLEDDDPTAQQQQRQRVSRDRDLCRLLIAALDNVDVRDPQLHTPLHVACERGHRDAAEHLLLRGAAVEARVSGMTPLMLAAREGHADVARLLVGHGADVDTRDHDAWVAWMHARAAGHAEADAELRRRSNRHTYCRAVWEDATVWCRVYADPPICVLTYAVFIYSLLEAYNITPGPDPDAHPITCLWQSLVWMVSFAWNAGGRSFQIFFCVGMVGNVLAVLAHPAVSRCSEFMSRCK